MKVLGSAQMRYASALLQHGSLVIRPSSITPYLISAAAASGMGGVGEQLAMTWDELAERVAAAFREALELGRVPR
jgi:hypothetical protein